MSAQPAGGDARYAVRSVLRALELLDALQQAPATGRSLADLARLVELPKSSAFRYLWTLEARGYVEKDPGNGNYRTGPALSSVAGRLERMAARGLPVMEKLRDRFQETVNLGVLNGSSVIYVEIVESPHAMRFAARKGERDPINSTALGKAVASVLPEEQVRAIISSEGLPRRTERTIVDADRFVELLAEVRGCGYALDDRENEEDGRCVAVPIPGAPLPAAISLSAPAARFPMDDVEEVAKALQEAAHRLGADLAEER